MIDDQTGYRIGRVIDAARKASEGDDIATFASILGALGVTARMFPDPVQAMINVVALASGTLVSELGSKPESVALAAVRAATDDDRLASLGVAIALMAHFLGQSPNPGHELDNVIIALTELRPDIIRSAASKELS